MGRVNVRTMSWAQGWPPVTFRPIRYPQASRLRGGIGSVAFGMAGIAFSTRVPPKDEAGLIVVSFLVLAFGVGCLVGARGQTTIDGQGLYTSSLLRRHSCLWSEVAGIRLDVNDKGDGPDISTIKIDLHDGQTFTLPAPRDHATGSGHDNPDFPAQLATIRRYWQANGGPVQP